MYYYSDGGGYIREVEPSLPAPLSLPLPLSPLVPPLLPDKVLSRIIEFLHAFSRLAMLVLMGLISESRPAGSVDRGENARGTRIARIVPG